jgi:hypothetical protein
VSGRGLAALAAVALIAGCGGGGGGDKAPGKNAKRFFGDQRDVAQVVDDLAEASRKGDPGAICEKLFTPSLAKTVAAQAGGSCPAKVKEELVVADEDITVQQLTITGTRALATVKEQNGKVSHLVFVRQDGEWRIDSID